MCSQINIAMSIGQGGDATQTASDDVDGTLEKAANAFEAFMEPNGPTKKNSKKPEQDEAEDDESEALDDDSSETQDEDEAEEADDESSEDDESTDDEESEEDEYDPNQMVTVKIDGKSVKVPLSEVLNGYQRQSDYSRKTQQLAEERRACETEAVRVRQEREHYTTVISAYQQQIAEGYQDLAPEQWDWLRQNDPLEYSLRKNDLRERQEQWQALEAQKNWIAQQQQAEAQKQFTNVLMNEREQMLAKKPEWRDPKVWNKVKADIKAYGQEMGYSEEELTNTTDHRAVIALYELMKSAKLASKKPVPARSENAPKRMPVEAPTSSTRSRGRSELSKAKQRLKQDGSISAASSVFERLL